MTRKRKILIGVGLALVVLVAVVVGKPQDTVYIHQMKQELIALANDKTETARRVAKMKKEGNWTDGRVGVAADGYVFYYADHDLHDSDNISDTHLLYLPDEKRFLLNHRHWCGKDTSTFNQAKNKAGVKRIFWRKW